jgi:hypothetical protein
MATILLSAAGSALGGALGGSVAGIGSLALGKAVGAVVGSAIDQRLLGLGSAPVETGRVERFRVMGSSEGAALPRVWGRTRVAGQVIWSSRFLESVTESDVGGKGGGGATMREFSYSVSLAVALCEGEVTRIGRIWADGQAVDQSGLSFRLHGGGEDQLPDPLILALEGDAPAYRGTAYVVFEDLDLTPYGNRIPQFNFEVFRRPAFGQPSLARDVRGVALVPGCGEYTLATEPVTFHRGKGEGVVLNVHNDRGIADLKASLDQLEAELPGARSVSLVASWFGDDLRCNRCTLRPKVEQSGDDGDPMPWVVSGLARGAASPVGRLDGRPMFGGTPADASVLQAIADLKARGLSVMFYPFILMDIAAGNGLADPWTGAADQPPVPWRGRITLAEAPGRPGSADKTAAAAAEVAAFFGQAQASDFEAAGATVVYRGPAEWSYRRFVLHYAHLCAMAGGVDAFCIGSEMRSLTQIRDSATGFPGVRALRDLAADVRAILGPETRIGYAADWSEYFGYQPADGSRDVLFHLDPLWASEHVDFVGIDNYMPLSDWRDGSGHADAAAGSIYDLGYLRANVAGGEGFDWYYADLAGREAQVRLPITDGAYGEDWVFRYKDLVGWWSNPHVNRIAGIKAGGPTAWVPRSKPIWFTELGCPAVNKGTNQPNVFYDPKSSESFFPYYSNGSRDDFIQWRYLEAMFAHWNDPANNPASDVYGGRMVDMARAHVWAWDARPWPDFPERLETWVDGTNYTCGHWLNGRASNASLSGVVSEICERSGVGEVDVSGLSGSVVGYTVEGPESGRQSLQPLMLAYAFDSVSVDGRLRFVMRGGAVGATLDPSECVEVGSEPVVALTRTPASETAGRVTIGFVRSDLDYVPGATAALAPDAAEPRTEQSTLPVVMSEGQAKAVAERALSEARVGRDNLSCSLPLSMLALTPGDVVALGGSDDLYRIDRIEELGHRAIEAVRIEPSVYAAPVSDTRVGRRPSFAPPGPVHVEFLDLPLLRGDENPVAPHVAVARVPWTGPVAVFSASDDHGYSFDRDFRRPAIVGSLLEALPAARPGLWMNASVGVRIASGSLKSQVEAEVLNGANAAALRHGAAGDWEVLQFRKAELVAPREYRLSGLLRGQAGTDGVIPETWPVGTDFVLLDAAVGQVPLRASMRGVERHYRVGPAMRPYDDPAYVHSVEAFAGVGLRPYRPAHLTARRRDDLGIELAWIRRSRIDGDSWAGTEVPLGEESESYLVRVARGAEVLREVAVTSSPWLYSAAEQASDGGGAGLAFEVAQNSNRFGPGPFARITFDG